MGHDSPISKVPPELLYGIMAEVYSAYIDYAITVPPPHELRRIQRQQAQLELDNPTGENMAVENVQTNAVAATPEDEDDLLDAPELSAPMLATWEAREAADPLPESQITPLLSVSRYIREIAMKVLHDSLGYTCGEEKYVQTSRMPSDPPNSFLNRNTVNPNITLKALRRLYRTVQSYRIPQQEEITKLEENFGTMSPLVSAYVQLSYVTYLQHHFVKLQTTEAESQAIGLQYQAALIRMLGMVADVSQADLQERILLRTCHFIHQIGNCKLYVTFPVLS